MTDIVERLRSRSRFDTCFPPETLMTMAADEIERLRNELSELRKAQGEPVATALMNKGKMVNAFPFPPNPDYNRDGYWTNKGYTQEPLYTSAPSIPEGWQLVPYEAIGKLLAQAMDQAVANGANSVSMPDEYVEIAAWLSAAQKK